MKRLKKAVIDKRTYDAFIDNLIDNGKSLLKNLDSYKFHLEQVIRIMDNDPDLASKLKNNMEILSTTEEIIQNIIVSLYSIDKELQYEKFKNGK